MIVVRLIGGLGNQLFQYALGRHLAEIHKAVLKLDISSFETCKLRKYSMWAFKIQENFASPDEIASLTVQSQGFLERVLARLLHKQAKPAPTHIREKRYYHFDSSVLNLPDGVYLDGYWQNEKYFADIRDLICREFTVKFPQVGKDKEIAEMIASTESVSLHIRRGDYVNNPLTKQTHGSLDMSYYVGSTEFISQKVKNPHFFIFSDDAGWVRDNLRLTFPVTFAEHNNAENNYEDLRLMSQCKHHIIANSTFSWWGAWLNQRPNKIICAPKVWFAQDTSSSQAIVPSGWYKF